MTFKYPAFFSYAHADDQAFGGYITRFHKLFSNSLLGHLQRNGLDSATPFLDLIDLSTAGNIDSLLANELNDSFALFIFVGQQYVNSNWCLKELSYFSSKFGGANDELKERVFILQIEPLNNLLEQKFKDKLTAANASELWVNVRNILYDTITRQRIPLKDPEGDETDKASEFVTRIANDLTGRIKAETPATKPKPTQFDHDVLICNVTADLNESCDMLKNQLEQLRLTVEFLPTDALTSLSLQELKTKLSSYKFAILPVSDSKVSFRFVPGGHIKLQFDAVVQSASPYLVWTPTASRTLTSEERESDEKHLEALQQVFNERRRLNPTEAAVKVYRTLKGPEDAAVIPEDNFIRVLIEMRDSEDATWEFVAEQLNHWWTTHFQDAAKKFSLRPEGVLLKRLLDETIDLSGDAVVVLREPDRDPNDTYLMGTCENVLRRNLQWKQKTLSVYPGLIAQFIPPEDSKPPLKRLFPLARFRMENDKLTYLPESPEPSLTRFLRRIELLKN
jgi:hypothetical protein